LADGGLQSGVMADAEGTGNLLDSLPGAPYAGPPCRTRSQKRFLPFSPGS